MNKPSIKLVWFGILVNYILLYLSIFDYLNNYMKSILPDLDSMVSVILVSIIGILNLASIFIGVLILSIIAYIFGRIFRIGITKREFLFICSIVMLVNTSIQIPIALANFINDSNNIVLVSNNLLFTLFNPFLLLSIFVFYKLLIKYDVPKKIIISYCLTFYFLQLGSTLLSNRMLNL